MHFVDDYFVSSNWFNAIVYCRNATIFMLARYDSLKTIANAFSLIRLNEITSSNKVIWAMKPKRFLAIKQFENFVTRLFCSTTLDYLRERHITTCWAVLLAGFYVWQEASVDLSSPIHWRTLVRDNKDPRTRLRQISVSTGALKTRTQRQFFAQAATRQRYRQCSSLALQEIRTWRQRSLARANCTIERNDKFVYCIKIQRLLKWTFSKLVKPDNTTCDRLYVKTSQNQCSCNRTTQKCESSSHHRQVLSKQSAHSMVQHWFASIAGVLVHAANS